MKGDYPCFRASYSHEELVEHFLLTPAERQFIAQCRTALKKELKG
jgi:hypothetical protein